MVQLEQENLYHLVGAFLICDWPALAVNIYSCACMQLFFSNETIFVGLPREDSCLGVSSAVLLQSIHTLGDIKPTMDCSISENFLSQSYKKRGKN